ncbi:MAG: hypothetical protein KAY22_02385 [Rhizorhabdus sp.]|uniref:hypothetical protein n=1 Tax=Rhizorhabdus sp. TaxID=1968843 RepID=UPI001B616C64|nr:hypothetical protein [Rhizorhabdus sp.]MBP8231129.1 hypothetical protein [Rhizorhabdus sp.]
MAVRVRSTSSLAEGAALELRAAAWAHQDRITADEADIAEGRRPPARPDTALAFDRASEQLDRSLDPDLRRSGHDPESVQGPEGAGLLSRGPMPAQQRTEPPALVEIRLPDPGLVGADHARKVTQSLESAFRSLDPAELVARHAAGREEAVRRRGPTGSLLAGEYARGVAVIERIAAERGIPLSADPRQKTARHVAGRRPDTNER